MQSVRANNNYGFCSKMAFMKQGCAR